MKCVTERKVTFLNDVWKGAHGFGIIKMQIEKKDVSSVKVTVETFD